MGNIKTTRYDIGAEVLSIITKGMYPDPKDTLREYIQNGVDADAKTIYVRIRKNSITIDDDGIGMDINTIRKAARVGVSEKNPGKDVGFMGIGIYSSFHLCDSLNIYSKQNNNPPCYLSMDFKGMRELLEEQKEKKLNQLLKVEDLVDLQSLLEKYIIIDETTNEDFPDVGTRVEIEGLNPEYINEFTNYEKLLNYLREVVPLEFDKRNFKWAEIIEQRINQICKDHDSKFELIKLFLQVNNQSEWLFRSYKDSDFDNNTSYKPNFYELKTKEQFFGVIWGCLNSTRHSISNKDVRGFMIKKQGFAIGKRQDLRSKFKPVYYDRFIGEVIVVHPKLIPNAARSDFAFSTYRTIFYNLIGGTFNESGATDYYNGIADAVQEYTKGDEQLDENIDKLKEINNNFSLYTKDPNKLIEYIIEIRAIKTLIRNRRDRGSIRDDRIHDANSFIKAAGDLENSIQATINNLTKQTKVISKKQKEAPQKVSKSLASIKTKPFETGYINLISLLESLDIPMNEIQKNIFSLIDERIIQSLSENEKNYFEILKDLKEEIEKII